MRDDRSDKLRPHIPIKFRTIAAALHAIFAIAFVINSITAGTFAFKGDRYQSILIYPLIRDN